MRQITPTEAYEIMNSWGIVHDTGGRTFFLAMDGTVRYCVKLSHQEKMSLEEFLQKFSQKALFASV